MDWADLPEGILSIILSNLFAKERLSFSLVCKPWNKAAKSSPFGHSPCLLNYQRTNCAWKFFQYNRFVSIDLPQKNLDGADIRCAKHGWMLMSKTDLTVFFYDPFNNETIHLPKLDSKYSVVCFFHPPTSRDCFVVGISNVLCSNDVTIGVLRRGENEWRRRVYRGESWFQLSTCTPVLHKRLLHFLDVEGNIGTFDVGSRSGSHGSWRVLTKCLLPPHLSSQIRQYFLIELREERALLSVLVAHEERKVYVFRLLLVSGSRMMKWVPVDDLGDKALFVSRKACFAATAPRQSMANRIYFAKAHGDDDDDVVFYCLGTRRYHSCKGDYSSKDHSNGFKDLNFATWITAKPTPEFPRDLAW